MTKTIKSIALGLRSFVSALRAGAGLHNANADFWGTFYSVKYTKGSR